MSPTQSHQSSGAAEKAISTVRGLARTYLAVIIPTNPSLGLTPDTPILLWTIRHAAWVLTRYNVRGDTRMTPHEKLRGQKYRREILSLDEQVLSRRPGANVNQLLQLWVTGLWFGRDTLSDEHLIGTAAGLARSRAVRRLQNSARCEPEALRRQRGSKHNRVRRLKTAKRQRQEEEPPEEPSGPSTSSFKC